MPKEYFLKRPFDYFLSLAGIFLSSPLWVIFCLLIWLEDAGPVFYFQERVGRDGIIFKGIKFRSMIKDAEKNLGPVQAQKNDPRITKIGRILRATAMDELPQLINIAKGEMSFVGPRSLRPLEIESGDLTCAKDIFHIPGFKKRSSIRPGLTGAAQVFASRSLPREEKFKYDLWYIDKMNFWLDLKFIIKSFLVTFRARWDI